MPTELRIFSAAYDFIDARLSEVLGQRLGGVLAEVSGPLRAALVLYVVLYGFAIFRGAITEPVMDFAIRGVKLVFIYAIATTPAYGDYVTQPLFVDLPVALASALSGEGGASVGHAFDEMINYAGYLGSDAFGRGSLADMAPWVVGAAVIIAGALAAALGFGVVMAAKVALALLVALGPIFVACALFEATRRYFFGWLSQGVNYLVLFGLILAVVQLMLDLVRSQWSAIEGQDPVAGGLVFVALCALAAFFFLHTPTIAAGIASGASLGLATFGGGAGRQAPSGRSGPQGATSGATRGSGQAAEGAAR